VAAPKDPEAMALACGEVRTCLLQTSVSLPERAAALLRLRADERVRVSERPNHYAVSPDLLTGIDCRLPTSSGAKVRAIGTVTSRAVLTDGRVLQSGAWFRSTGVPADQRQHWGHYLVRPGTVECLGRVSERALIDGLLTGFQQSGELDLGAIAERLLGDVLRHPLLDHSPPFKSRPTRLRWAALRAPEDEGPSVRGFTLAEDGLRTVELRLPDGMEHAAARWCEDLALHDWLLTTLIRMVERGRVGQTDGRDALRALRPAVDHLLHLWLPGARTEPALRPLWGVLEQEVGFSRQWQTLVQRIRDQLALHRLRGDVTV